MKIALITYYLIIMLNVFFLTIGFSAYANNMSISDIGATVLKQEIIKITDVTIKEISNGATSNYESSGNNEMSSYVVLPNSNSTITYYVEITNLGNVEMGLLAINGLQSNLTYSISDYKHNVGFRTC